MLLISACGSPDTGAEAVRPDQPRNPVTQDTLCEKGGPLVVEKVETVFSMPARTDRFCALILSLSTETLNKITSGERVFDFRKSHPSDKISHVIFFDREREALYGVATVVQTLVGPPRLIIEQTLNRSASSRDDLSGYFGESRIAFAIELAPGSYKPFAHSISLAEARVLDPSFHRPVGYAFLERHPRLNSMIFESEIRPPNEP